MGAIATPAMPAGDTVWVDDAIPAGATAAGPVTFASSQAASGTQSIAFTAAGGVRDWSFSGATATLAPATGDLLVAYALINPCNPPRQILFAWSDGTAEFRASWGEDRIEAATAHTRVAPMPDGGVWQRLEVRASAIGAAGKTLKGLTIKVFGGEAWIDHVAKAACSLATAAKPSSFPQADVVWFDDQMPAGATAQPPDGGRVRSWIWDSSQSVSGSASHTDGAGAGPHEHYFLGSTEPLVTNPGDLLTTYVLLDPCNPPRQVMLSWRDASGWEHRGYWGEDLLLTNNGSQGNVRIGPLPESGKWVRLEVPAAVVGLDQTAISGQAFTVYDGQAWFDRSGRIARVNLAYGKPARQSSDYSADYPASRAVDGNLASAFGVMSVTGYTSSPWWEVDFGAVSPIDAVEIRGRTDCCLNQTSNFVVLVSDDPITATDLATARSQAGTSAYSIPGEVGKQLHLAIHRTGRYVRIWRTNTDSLTLPEVLVWAPATAARVNLAGGRKATSSSIYLSYLPEFGVNGSVNDAWNGTGSISHTTGEAEPWWQVDLGSSQNIGKVDISGRTDCCLLEQMTGFYLLVSDQPFAAVPLATTLADSGVAAWYHPTTPMTVVSVDVNRRGRYVRIQKAGPTASALTLSEVRVWAAQAVLKPMRLTAPVSILSVVPPFAPPAAAARIEPPVTAVRPANRP
jgi:hypothetical protein